MQEREYPSGWIFVIPQDTHLFYIEYVRVIDEIGSVTQSSHVKRIGTRSHLHFGTLIRKKLNTCFINKTQQPKSVFSLRTGTHTVYHYLCEYYIICHGMFVFVCQSVAY